MEKTIERINIAEQIYANNQDNLSLTQLTVIYPGNTDYPLTKNIFVVDFDNYFSKIPNTL